VLFLYPAVSISCLNINEALPEPNGFVLPSQTKTGSQFLLLLLSIQVPVLKTELKAGMLLHHRLLAAQYISRLTT
jgi:hypothetical protein